MTTEDSERKKNRYHFDRHTPEYRQQFSDITAEMLDNCPVAWSDTYGGHTAVLDRMPDYACDPAGEQRLADPVTVRKGAANIK